MQILFTLKANKSQAKEIKRLLIQKKIQVELTSIEDTTQNSRKINTVARTRGGGGYCHIWAI